MYNIYICLCLHFAQFILLFLGTEEVKKYAILNKKDGEEDSDDDDDFDREDRDISFNHDVRISLIDGLNH